jgi:hypothetical protein
LNFEFVSNFDIRTRKTGLRLLWHFLRCFVLDLFDFDLDFEFVSYFDIRISDLPMQFLSIGKKKRIYAIAFAPNGQELAAPAATVSARLGPDHRATCGSRSRSSSSRTTSIAYHPDGERLVFSGLQCQGHRRQRLERN